MLALLFEVTPKQSEYQRYLEIAARMRNALERHEGVLFLDRFRSLSRSGTILSHSRWRDEAALAAWRTFEPHHEVQVLGREEIFEDYRLRIAQVVQEQGPGRPNWQPARLTAYRDPAVHAPRYVVIATCAGADSGTMETGVEPADVYQSLNREGEFLSVYDVPDHDSAVELADRLIKEGMHPGTVDAVRICEVERDYGMFDRREAPQYYPPINR